MQSLVTSVHPSIHQMLGAFVLFSSRSFHFHVKRGQVKGGAVQCWITESKQPSNRLHQSPGLNSCRYVGVSSCARACHSRVRECAYKSITDETWPRGRVGIRLDWVALPTGQTGHVGTHDVRMIIMTDRASGPDWHDVTGTLMIHTAWHETQLKSQINQCRITMLKSINWNTV